MMPGPISQFLMEPGGTNYSAAGLGRKIPPPWNIIAQLSTFTVAQNFSWHQLFSFGKDKILESTAPFCCCNFLKKFSLLPERIASHEYACIRRHWASQGNGGAFPREPACRMSWRGWPLPVPISLASHWVLAQTSGLSEVIWTNVPKHSAGAHCPKESILTLF